MAVGEANGAISQSKPESELKTFTLDDLKQHTTEKSCWLSIRGSVYDVTDFLEEHPGGYDIIIAATGRDATDDYEDINHSRTADDMLKSYLIGSLADGEVKATQAARPVAARPPVEVTPSSTLAKVLQVLAPLLLVALAVFIKIYGDALKDSMAQRS